MRAPSGRHPADPAAGETPAVAAERVPEIFEIDGPCPALLELTVRLEWREKLGIAGDGTRPVPVTPVPSEHRGFRSLLVHFENETGSSGHPLTEDARPRDIRMSTSTPESLE